MKVKNKFCYKDRYDAEKWKVVRKKAIRATSGRCVLCGKIGKLEVHHAVYCRSDGTPIAGNEKIGLEVFPLCIECHKEAHSYRNWVRDRRQPELWNRNSIPFWKKMREGFLCYSRSPRIFLSQAQDKTDSR